MSFAVLGPAESCTGDPVRRLGNEYLYQMQAQQNIETLNAAGVKKVIASCPHCFNSLSKEYPALGGNFEVIHHSQLLGQARGRGQAAPEALRRQGHLPRPVLPRPPQPGLRPAPLGHRVGAGRGARSRWTAAGSAASAAAPAVPACGSRSDQGKRINLERTDEALATGADVVSTACPFCLIMLDDAVKERGRDDDVKVLDVAQLLERSMEVAAGAPGASPETAGP